MTRWYERQTVARFGLILVGLMMISSGLGPLLQGRFFYYSLKIPSAGPVFSPIAIILGLFVIFLAVFHWGNLQSTGTKRKSKQ